MLVTLFDSLTTDSRGSLVNVQQASILRTPYSNTRPGRTGSLVHLLIPVLHKSFTYFYFLTYLFPYQQSLSVSDQTWICRVSWPCDCDLAAAAAAGDDDCR